MGWIYRKATSYLPKKTFDLNLTYFTISTIIKISIGLVLGLEYLINEMEKEGTWKINLPIIFTTVQTVILAGFNFLVLRR